uniref:cation:proton antiporter n=1 Tax=Ningiella ruwaisensis TaxID=2364274 RepID=UPI00109F780D|nr:cation:proton antiporter family protein [Ningiella ruwaisensis]
MLDIIHQSSFIEITALLALTAIAGFIGSFLRQPLIVSFILVGLIAGPSVLDIVHSKEKIALLSELGIALLLFLVGIKLDVKLIRSIGPVSLMTGLGQVIFTSLVGYLIGLALGLDHITSIYVAVALTFSSTIIIVKLLSDKREIDSLHGQIALGFLIVQDLVVVFSMIVLATIGMGNESGNAGIGVIIQVILSGLALVAFVMFFIKYLANPFTAKLAKAPELLVICSLALATLFASAGTLVGLGKELGGLLAGVALASTPIKESIASRMAPLRDFLLLFFFIALGATLDLSLLGNYLFEAIVFSLFVLIGNPLIVLIIMGALGYRKRTGFLAGLTVAQISEFSLIFVAMGVTIGHVAPEVAGLVTLVGIITIASSTYMITYSHTLYRIFEPALDRFERKEPTRELSTSPFKEGERFDLVMFGLGRFGSSVAKQLSRKGLSILAIDFNPDVVEAHRKKGMKVSFGDATDADFVSELPLAKAKWVVSTIPTHHLGLVIDDTRKTIVQLSKAAGFEGKFAVVSHSDNEAMALKHAGIDLVLKPYTDAATRACELLINRFEASKTES